MGAIFQEKTDFDKPYGFVAKGNFLAILAIKEKNKKSSFCFVIYEQDRNAALFRLEECSIFDLLNFLLKFIELPRTKKLAKCYT